MHIAIVGAGAMGADVVSELARREPGLTLSVIDADGGRAETLARKSGLRHASSFACDARDTDTLGQRLANAAVTVNAAQYDTNLDVMAACLRAGSHYLDLGGMFHTTRKQLKLDQDFRQAGLTAVLGMGAAPGLSNLLAVAACEGMERVDEVHLAFAGAAPDMPASDVFVPPYSIRTIMQEFGEPSVQWVEGDLREFRAMEGRRRFRFPEPIGEVDCVYTLHSEPATLPGFLAGRGVREVTWRLGLPAPLELAVQAFGSAGLGAETPLRVGNVEIAPIAFLAACIDDRVARAARPAKSYTELGCVRAEAIGLMGGAEVRVAVESVLAETGQPPNMAGVITGTPAAVAALMLAAGEANSSGVSGPERVIDPSTMIARLAERGFRTYRSEHRLLG